jgi:hypothetical protein
MRKVAAAAAVVTSAGTVLVLLSIVPVPTIGELSAS